MDRTQKQNQIEYIKGRFEKAKTIIFADYRGLNVSDITDLRRKLRQSNAEMRVVKNRLAKKAASTLKIDGLSQVLTGPTAMTSSDVDAVIPAKILVNFAKDHGVFEIKAAYMDGKILDVKEIRHLASLPSKEVLLSRALASMQAPITNFTLVLATIPRQLANVVNAIKEQKEKQTS